MKKLRSPLAYLEAHGATWLVLGCLGLLTACGGSENDGGASTPSSGGSAASGGSGSGGASSGGSPGIGGRLGATSGVVAEFEPAPTSLIPPLTGCDETPSDCGGDPTGTWRLGDACTGRLDCPGASGRHTHTATVTFGPDGTYQASSGATTLISTTPFECDPAIEAACPTVSGCVVENDACKCEFNLEGDGDGAQGQWAVLGNQLRLLVQNDNPEPRQFTLCVQGDRMQIWTVLDENLTSLQVFERQ
jgi:hypothetical protein